MRWDLFIPEKSRYFLTVRLKYQVKVFPAVSVTVTGIFDQVPSHKGVPLKIPPELRLRPSG